MNPEDRATDRSESERQLDAIEDYDVVVMIERDGKTVAVMLSPERYERLLQAAQ